VEPGDVDLVAPKGTIDAGDAGIHVSGNLNIAAVHVLNATNIQSGGTSTGVPSATPAPPNISGLAAAANASTASSKSADGLARQAVSSSQVASMQSMPSIVSVQVLGYGGGDGTEEDKKSGESSVQ
jgi:filamentous hemagglutinin